MVGDSLELMTPQGNITFNLTEMRDLKGNPITDAKGSGHFVEIPLSQDVDISYALLIRNLPHAKKVLLHRHWLIQRVKYGTFNYK